MNKQLANLSNLLISLGIFFLVFPFIPIILSELNFWWHATTSRHISNVQPKVVEGFRIYIPKLALSSDVITKVNPFDSKAYLPALKNGVAHALGSALPDQAGTVYLFAHSTDAPWRFNQYNAQFYLLHQLQPDDLIYLDYQGSRYTYQIKRKQVINSTAVDYLSSSQKHSELILQTCWPPGTTWKRLLVLADLI